MHLVVISAAAFGHARGMCCFVASLHHIEPDLTITFLCHATYEDKCRAVFASCGLELPDSRLRIIALGSLQDGDQNPLAPLLEFGPQVIEQAWPAVVQGKSCGGHEAMTPPTALLSDFFTCAVVQEAQKMDNKLKSIWSWGVCNPQSFRMMVENRQVDTPFDSLLDMPGIPSLYSYELQACSTPFPVDMIAGFERQAMASWMGGPNAICSFSRDLMPDAINASFADPRAVNFTVEPQYPASFWSSTSTISDTALSAFLSAAETNHGQSSVVFMSFGTLFFPMTRPEYIIAFLDALIAHEMPFILVMASMLALQLPPDLDASIRNKVESSGNYVTAWIEQEATLAHPSIGWVVTHAGCNSVLEALVQGLPLIVWPFSAEQASNAAWLAMTLDLAFELLQVRDRLIGKKLYNHPDVQITASIEAVRDEFDRVLRAMIGEEGARKRAHAQKAGRLLKREHAEKGETYLREFLQYV